MTATAPTVPDPQLETPAGTRGKVYDLVRDEPGLAVQDVADRLAVDHSTAAYHLHRLESSGHVVAHASGRTRCHYANGSGLCPYLKHVLPRLRADGAGPALARALERGDVTAADLEARGVDVGAARWALHRLEDAGLLRKVARGRWRLREDTAKCALHALGREGCQEWGRCVVSREDPWDRGS